MRITFLGTSAGTPTRERNVTAQAVTFDDGRVWLLDCGEGTQHQVLRSGLRASRIERILVTHLHGDHCFGLPGLLCFMGINGRSEPVRVLGPRGVAELVATTLRLSATELPFALHLDELDGPADLVADNGWTIAARPLAHRVTCLGYSLREPPRPGRFHPERAAALGIPPGPAYRVLQEGGEVPAPDGRRVAGSEVSDPPRRGRHLVLLGDTSDPSAIIEAGRGCDVAVHEVTYDRAREDKARRWGHSTSAMAGDFAAAVQARTLIITHFSSRFAETTDEPLTIADLVREVAERCPGTTVLAAEDLWGYDVG